jgi:hypothetical protein
MWQMVPRPYRIAVGILAGCAAGGNHPAVDRIPIQIHTYGCLLKLLKWRTT